MTNRSSFELENIGHAANLLLAPGFLTSVMALATLSAPSVQKVSMKTAKSFENCGRNVRKKLKS